MASEYEVRRKYILIALCLSIFTVLCAMGGLFLTIAQKFEEWRMVLGACMVFGGMGAFIALAAMVFLKIKFRS